MSATLADAEISRLLGFYLTIEQASRSMLEAALESDWERVGEIHDQCGALIAQVRRLSGRIVLPREEQRAKLRIIRQIVRNEAQIRRLAYPWSERYEHLVFGGVGAAGTAGRPA